jgi:GTPase SAR1 family protein
MSSDEEYNYICKVCLLGKSSVGKSSYILRLTNDQFNQNQETTYGVGNYFKIKKKRTQAK